MKFFLSAILICCLWAAGIFAQVQPMGLMRSLDDNHALATDSADWKFHRKIKEIRLQKGNPELLLSFGGEDREQFRFLNQVNFGDVNEGLSHSDVYFQHRLLLHADLRVNKHFRFFTQFSSCHANGGNDVAHKIDQDMLGAMQAFVDLKLYTPVNMQLRLGRQEFYFGMERILGLRDGLTIRQNFDGARLTLKPGKITGDILLVQPVLYSAGTFDNSRREDEYVFGAYWTVPLIHKSLLDAYYFAAGYQDACFAGDTADDNRHSFGLRLNKSSGAFTYDFEYTIQFGNHGESSIKAWQVSSQIAWRWVDIAGKPRLLLRESIFTGDKTPEDGKINTFRPVSTKTPVHDLVPIGHGNIMLVSPEAEVLFFRKLLLTIRFLYVSRFSGNDGIYQSDMRRMTRPLDGPGEDLGHHITTGVVGELLYNPNKHVILLLYGGLFKAGDYIRNTGRGMDVEAFSIRVTYRF